MNFEQFWSNLSFPQQCYVGSLLHDCNHCVEFSCINDIDQDWLQQAQSCKSGKLLRQEMKQFMHANSPQNEFKSFSESSSNCFSEDFEENRMNNFTSESSSVDPDFSSLDFSCSSESELCCSSASSSDSRCSSSSSDCSG